MDLFIPGWGVAPGSPGGRKAPDQPDHARRRCCCALLLGTFSRFASLASGPGHSTSQGSLEDGTVAACF